MEYGTAVAFSDLADSKELREFFSITRELTGMLIALVDATGTQVMKLFSDEGENPLCLAVKSCPSGRAGCHETDRANYRRAAAGKTAIAYLCHAGLVDLSVPVFVQGKHIATINCGQVLPAPPSEEGFLEFAARNGALAVEASRMKSAYFSSPYMDVQKLDVVLRLCSFFADYFCEVGSRLKAANRERGTAEVDKAREYLARHFREQLSLGEVASHVGFSPQYFSSLFRRVTGATFTSYLQGLRVEEAKRRLSATEDRIAEIAFGVGFGTQTHFNRAFAAAVGCPPREYRRAARDPAP